MRSSSLRIAFLGLAVALAVALLAGCSVVRLAYSQLDRWLAWRVEEYVTLTPGQRAWLGERLQTHLAWHCRTQVPAYADWLRSLLAELERVPPDSARLSDHARQVGRFLDAMLETLAPTAAELPCGWTRASAPSCSRDSTSGSPRLAPNTWTRRQTGNSTVRA